MDDTVIVTASNSRYFQFLQGLVRSIRYAAGLDSPAIAILDVGLTQEECDWLELNNCIIKPLQSPYGHQAAYTELPKLPELFPDYNIFIRIDADAWVQDWNTVKLLYEGASQGYFVGVPEVDIVLAFNKVCRIGANDWAFNLNKKLFSQTLAEKLYEQAIFNAGVYALNRDHEIWQKWQSAMWFALNKNNGPTFAIDQATLNYAIYSSPIEKIMPLPLINNWLVEYCRPVIKEGYFTAPYFPYKRIGIMHMIDNAKWTRFRVSEVIDGKAVPVEKARYINFNEFLAMQEGQ